MTVSLTEDQKGELKEILDENLTDLVTEIEDNGQPKLHAVLGGITDKNGDIYVGAQGVKDFEGGEPINLDSMVSYFSLTKSMTALAILVLHEQGLIDLDNPAKDYLPLISQVQLIKPGLVDQKTGEFTIPPEDPKTDITIRHLLLHISGFAYAFSNKDCLALAVRKNPHVNATVPSMELFTTEKNPLLLQPGSKWMYGVSFDWLGLIVKEVSGKHLGEFLQEHVFGPATMTSCTFHVRDTSNFIKVLRRDNKNNKILTAKGARPLQFDPSIDMGGQGCFGTLRDFLKFMRIWLNKGYSPDGKVQILSTKIADYALKNHLPEGFEITFDFSDGGSSGSNPLAGDGFSLTGCGITSKVGATGRPVGSHYWFGLANLFFWIDFENEVAGLWGTQVLPQMDTESLVASMRFEYNFYEFLEESKAEPSLKL